jgi:PilZ domain
MPDRRRYPRCELRSAIEFTGSNPRNVTFGFAIDLSPSGAFVQTAFPAVAGSPVVVRFWRPGWLAELPIRGVVRWSHSGGMGVEFVGVGGREAALLDELRGDFLPTARAM